MTDNLLFEALGKPVPQHRKDAAYKLIRSWEYDADTALAIVGRVAHHIERDEPYAAQKVATGGAPLARPESSATPPFHPDPDMPEFKPGVTAGLMIYAHLMAG